MGLMNQQMKGEGRDLGEFQQVGLQCHRPLVIPRAGGNHLVPLRLPGVALELPATGVVPPPGTSSSSDALASQATLVTKRSWTCSCESFSWLWQYQLLLFPLQDPVFELG